MNCPVCKKKLQMVKEPYHAYTSVVGNYRERKRIENERRNRSLEKYVSVKAIYNDVLGVKERNIPYYMHLECADAYNATLKILISTGEINPSLIHINKFSEFINYKFLGDQIDAFTFKSYTNTHYGKLEGNIINNIFIDDAEASMSDIVLNCKPIPFSIDWDIVNSNMLEDIKNARKILKDSWKKENW